VEEEEGAAQLALSFVHSTVGVVAEEVDVVANRYWNGQFSNDRCTASFIRHGG